MCRRGIEKEIRQLERDIARKESECAASTSVLSHSPRAPSADRDKVARLATEIVYLRGELEKRVSERDEMLRYIESVPDAVTRTAMRLYFIRGYSWRRIAREVNYSRTGITKKVHNFLKECPK